jgi:hypothetical protein
MDKRNGCLTSFEWFFCEPIMNHPRSQKVEPLGLLAPGRKAQMLCFARHWKRRSGETWVTGPQDPWVSKENAMNLIWVEWLGTLGYSEMAWNIRILWGSFSRFCHHYPPPFENPAISRPRQVNNIHLPLPTNMERRGRDGIWVTLYLT